MEDLIKADIFFFITSVAVIFFSIIFIVIGIYIVLILKRTKKFIEMVKEEGGEVIEDIKVLRASIRENEGVISKVGGLFGFIRKMAGMGKGYRRKGKSKN